MGPIRAVASQAHSMNDLIEDDAPSGLRPLGPEPPEQELRGHLAMGLFNAGYDRVCLENDCPPSAPLNVTWAGVAYTLAITLAIGLGLGRELSMGTGWTIALIAVLTIGVPAVCAKWSSVLAIIAALWGALGIFIWVTDGFDAWVASYGVALACSVALLLVLQLRRMRLGIDPRALARSIPLLFPLVLLLLFIPLVTADLWRVASAADATRLIVLALIVLLPLAIVLVGRLIGSLPTVVDETATSLAADPDAVRDIPVLLDRLVGDYAGSWVLNYGLADLRPALRPAAASGYVPFLAVMVRRPLIRALAIRTALMLLGLGICVFGYLYLMGAILVTPEVAEQWSHAHVPSFSLEAFGLAVHPPGGPYLAITTLLSIIAVGAFLAFVIVEATYATAMAGALLHKPVREYLLLALPYTRLRERVILGEVPTDQFGVFADSSASTSEG